MQIGLQLVVGIGNRGVLRRGVLQFKHGQRQAVDEQDKVRATIRAVLDYDELRGAESTEFRLF